jgi:hypothetical protein
MNSGSGIIEFEASVGEGGLYAKQEAPILS